MIKMFITLQELRKRIYCKAKADKVWRFWGIYVHVCKLETIITAYNLAKKNDGAPGIDGVTFDMVEESGLEQFLKEIQASLMTKTYCPMRNRLKEIPKGNGKTRTIGVPTIRDRVVQGALKLIMEPIFEADFQEGSFGGRPKRSAHQAIDLVSHAINVKKSRIIDIDLKTYFDTVRHDKLLAKVAQRVQDTAILWLLKRMLKANGKIGLGQGSVLSPLLSNIYLNEIDKMLEKAKEVTRNGKYTRMEYARYLDDLIVLIDSYREGDWLVKAIPKRLSEEFEKLGLSINTEKTKIADLAKGETISFLGFDFRQRRTKDGKTWALYSPMTKARTKVIRRMKEIFQRYESQPIKRVIELINPILRGWTNYFRIGHASQCFSYVRDWTEKKIRRHLGRARARKGFGWKVWSRAWIYRELRLFRDYQIRWLTKDVQMSFFKSE